MSYTLKDINFNPKKTAFLLVDYQNFFVGHGVQLEAVGSTEACPAINRVLAEMKAMGSMIIYTNQSHELMNHYFYSKKWPEHFPNGTPILRPGTHEFKVYDGITVEPDYQITKNRWSAFFQTNLQLILSNFDIENVCLGGCTTSVCTEATARDASTLGYNTVMVSDFCFGFNDLIKNGSLANWDLAWGIVATSDEVLEALHRDKVE